MSDTIKLVGLVGLLILLIVFSPLITLWALNTLFNLGIAYTIWTWLATAWLSLVTFGSVTSAISKKN
jgi:multidrug transporter EmrE-like cation transporter